MSSTKQFPRICRAPVVVVGTLLTLVSSIGLATACTDESAVPPTTTVGTSTNGTSSSATTAPTTTAAPDLLHDVDAVLKTDTVWDPDKMDAVRDYVRAEQAFLRAAADPVSPDDPEVSARFVGEAQRARQDALSNARASGRAATAPQVFVFRPEAVERLDANTVAITVCLTTRVPFVDLATGAVLDDAEFSDRTEAQLNRASDQWSVSTEHQIETWDGDSCR